MNDPNVVREGGEGLEIICYKVAKLCMKQYSVIRKWTLISHKCIFQTLEQTLKFFWKKYNWKAKRREKMESYKMLNETKAWKNGKQKQEQKINNVTDENNVIDGKQLQM